MKKILILLAAILFGISASFAQGVYTVTVSWQDNDNDCECEGTIAGSYFEATIDLYDDANGEDVITDLSETAAVDKTSVDIPVDDVEDYCNEQHQFTPSFTVTAIVKYMCDATNPPTSVCSGTEDDSAISCHDFYNDKIPVPTIELEP